MSLNGRVKEFCNVISGNNVRQTDEGVEQRRLFVRSLEGQVLPLSELERRLGITDVDDPNPSVYYSPENPAQIAHAKQVTNDFLEGKWSLGSSVFERRISMVLDRLIPGRSHQSDPNDH
jgi:hypothetical protein